MSISAYIEQLLASELGGDLSRFDELWDRVPNFGQRLREFDDPSSWLHWTPNTYDGWYCLKQGSAFVVFAQERGDKSSQRAFATEREAVRYAIDVAVYPLKHAI